VNLATVTPGRYRDSVVEEQKKSPEANVCPHCLDVWLYCWCPIENPPCETCSFVLTECVCPGAPRVRLDRWA